MSQLNIKFGTDFIEVTDENLKEKWKSLDLSPSKEFLTAFLANAAEEKSSLIRHAIRNADLNEAAVQEGYVSALQDVFDLLNDNITDAFKDLEK